jgi:hypothetical protein
VNRTWSEAKNHPDDKFYDEDWQEWKARNQISWFIRIVRLGKGITEEWGKNTLSADYFEQGDDISTTEPVEMPLKMLYRAENASMRKISETIYISESNPPPGRWKDGGVKELCTIEWDAKLDISSLPTFANRLGKVFYRLNYTIVMTCAGGSLDFAVYHDGKRQGSKNVVVDHESRSSDSS